MHLNGALFLSTQPGFCSWNCEEMEIGNKEKWLSRFFVGKHSELWQDQKTAQGIIKKPFRFETALVIWLQ